MSCCSDFSSKVCEFSTSSNGGRAKRKSEYLEEIGIQNGNEIEVKTIEELLKSDDIMSTSNGSTYKVKQLFSRNGYNLAILNGHVRGIRDAYHPHSVLQLIPVGVGEVKIQGVECGKYLAMNPKGKLYAEEDEANEATIFLESSNGYYLNYLSKKYAHLGWYVGIKKNGQTKNGKKTWYPWGQKAIEFVPRKAFDEPHPLRQIRNRHGLVLAIMNDAAVVGVPDESSANKNAILEFIPTDPPGAFRIRGIEANLFLSMDANGNLYGESDRTDGGTIFAEHVQGQYFVYLSAKFAHQGWHVGLSKSGKAKKGPRTAHPPGQKAIQFVRKPIVPVTPNLGKLSTTVDLENRLDLAFIDEGEETVVSKGPTQVRKIVDQ